VNRSLSFEQINILYNLAALYSSLAMNSHGADDIYKMAANYFSLSAGVIKHLQTNVIPSLNINLGDDMDAYSLQCMENVMLAQAQEFVWQKAVKDGLKDITVAKLAAKISDLFATAVDLGTKSDGITSPMIHHMKARHFHFAAVAQYRAACDCLNKRQYGEEVARLRDCLDCVAEGLKETKYVNREVVGALNALKSKAQDDLKRAEKDNDIIYLMPVPSKFELKSIERILMVSPKIPPELSDPLSRLGDHGELGRPLFAKVPPYAVKVATKEYKEARDKVINGQIIAQLDTLHRKMHDLLQALGLPSAVEAIDVPLGLPESLLNHAREVRQQDGPQRIQRSMQETEKVKTEANHIFQEGIDILETEADEDEMSRRKYGTDRWSRPTSEEAGRKLYDRVKQIQGYLDHAQSSDTLIRNKLINNEKLISVLAGSEDELRRFVPNSGRSAAPAAVVQAATKLRFSLKEVSRLERQQKAKIDAVEFKTTRDKIRECSIQVLNLAYQQMNRRRSGYGSCKARARLPDAKGRI
jgi:programmed cell death 6-interacting protein